MVLNVAKTLFSFDGIPFGVKKQMKYCTVAKCTYSMCMKRRLLPGGICGETVKRKTVEKDLDADGFVSDPIKLKGKALRKLGDQDYLLIKIKILVFYERISLISIERVLQLVA